MDISKLSRRSDCGVTPNRTCASESKTKNNCGCKIILPVSGFECYLCKVFIRDENDIEDHVVSIQHLTIYEVHLQTHNQVRDVINPNEINANEQCLEDDITSVENDGLIERNASENSVCDGNLPEENDAVGGNAREPERTETDSNRIDRELSKSVLSKSKSSDRVRNIVDDTGFSRIDDLNMQNVDGTLSNNQVQPGNGQVLDASGTVTRQHFHQLEWDQIAHDSSKRCNTMVGNEESGGILGVRQVKLEDNDANDIELNRKVSSRNERINDNDQCSNVKAVMERTEGNFSETFIKEEEYDDDDGACGIIEGFLEDESDDLLDNDVHCNGELMPGFSSLRESQNESIKSCTANISTSAGKWRPTFTSQSLKTPEFNETSATKKSDEISETGAGINMEIDANINSNINACVGTEHPQKGSCKRCRNTVNRERGVPDNVCGKSFNGDGDELVKVHQGINRKEKPYACDECEMKFSRSDSLKRHKEVHIGKHPFLCNSCGKSFRRFSHLKVHERIHTGEKPYSCKVCGKSFRQGSNLNRHERIHTREKRQFSCGICGQSFRWKYALIMHGSVHTGEEPPSHSGEKSHSCNICGESFRLKRSLIVHRRIHTREEPYSCNMTEKSCRQASDLKVNKRVHTDEKLYSCNVCGKSFRKSYALITHVTVHTGERPYLCDLCGKSFSQNSHLKVHKMVHTGEMPYSCDVCGKSFRTKHALIKHGRVHTGEKPYSCNLCGKSFTRSSYLSVHERVHTGEMPYSCDVCGKSFKQIPNLKRHKTVHTGERPFSCSKCGKSVKTHDNLKRHIKTHAEDEL